ncbi:MAG: hypothetical protein ACRC53_06760 [Plesiomonas sp.]|uniref:hypothetical protein n=1 Tax=Plesiomonas sp. TaxID=2486279 RepID=UPI003F30E640
MQESTRARVAAIIGASACNKRVLSVYDYQAGRYKNTQVKITEGRISGYDLNTQSGFQTHNSRAGKLDFYDAQTHTKVQLELSGNRFKGYDFHTGKYFHGSINGRNIGLYDTETGRQHHYSAR